jgi:hypothetical protein
MRQPGRTSGAFFHPVIAKVDIMSIFGKPTAVLGPAVTIRPMVRGMDCTFHVEAGGVPDWAEWRVDRPTRGEHIVHDGRGYDVVSAVSWLAEGLTCFVAVTPQVVDLR